MTLVILSRRFQRDNAGVLDEAAGSPDQAEAGIRDFMEDVRRVTDQMQGTQAPTVERYEVAIFDA